MGIVIMDTEQLKLILEVIQGAGEGTKEVAIWYMVTMLIDALIQPIAWIVIIFLIIKGGSKLVMSCNLHRQAWYSICHLVDRRGIYDPTQQEVEMVARELKERFKEDSGNE